MKRSSLLSTLLSAGMRGPALWFNLRMNQKIRLHSQTKYFWNMTDLQQQFDLGKICEFF